MLPRLHILGKKGYKGAANGHLVGLTPACLSKQSRTTYPALYWYTVHCRIPKVRLVPT